MSSLGAFASTSLAVLGKISLPGIVMWFATMSLIKVHIIIVVLAVCFIAMADHEALEWIRGKKQTLSRKYMLVLHILTWTTLIGLLISGTLLVWFQYYYLLHKPLFIMKLIMVGVLFTNAIIIGNGMDVALEEPFVAVGWKDRLPLLTSGAISTMSWSTVIVLGYYLYH